MVEFGLGERALVGHDDPEGRIGEPDRAVGRDRNIVGRVDPLALVMGHDRLGLPIIIAAPADAAPAVLAVDERAVRLDRIAIHEPRAVESGPRHDRRDTSPAIAGWERPTRPIDHVWPATPVPRHGAFPHRASGATHRARPPSIAVHRRSGRRESSSGA